MRGTLSEELFVVITSGSSISSVSSIIGEVAHLQSSFSDQQEERTSPRHLPQSSYPDEVIHLHSLDEDSNKADEGKLHKGNKDHREAQHNVEVQSCDPTWRMGPQLIVSYL